MSEIMKYLNFDYLDCLLYGLVLFVLVIGITAGVGLRVAYEPKEFPCTVENHNGVFETHQILTTCAKEN